MRSDHRRPLVAYVLVSVACAFVVAPSLDLGGLGLGQKPTFSAFSDTTMTPSEVADRIVDPSRFAAAPEGVAPPVTDDDGSLAPGVGAIKDVLGGALFGPDDPGSADVPTDAAPSTTGGGGDLVVDPLRSHLVGAGGNDSGQGTGNDTGGDTGGSSGGDPGAPGTADPTPSEGKGNGIFDGFPSHGEESPGEGGGDPAGGGGGSGTPGPEDGPGNGHGNGNGNGNAAPHSFDHVPPGAHPYGHVGNQDNQNKGPQDKEPKEPKEPKGKPAKEPEKSDQGQQGKSGQGNGKAHGHHKHGR